MLYDFDGTGEVELVCSAYTLSVYEQEFKNSMIADVYGVVDLTSVEGHTVTSSYVLNKLKEANDGADVSARIKTLVEKAFPAYMVTKLDYSADNWEAYLRASWAMMKTANIIAGKNDTPAFMTWLAGLGPVDMKEVSRTVLSCMEDGVFHTRNTRN